MNKQSRYESFLDSIIIRNRKTWFQCLPTILNDLAVVINQVGAKIEADYPEQMEKFEATRVRLRPLYKQVKMIMGSEQTHDNEMDIRAAVKDMIHIIRSWYQSSNIAVSLEVITDRNFYGKAVVATKYYIVVSNKF